MRVEYTIRLEPQTDRRQDLICWMVLDRTDYCEIHRVPGACEGVGVDATCSCSDAIDACMAAAEEDWGGRLPWAFPDDEELARGGGRVAWTGGLVRPTPSLLGSEL